MTRQEIEIKVKRVITEQLAIEEERVKPESVIALGLGSDTDLCADSLGVVEIIMALEEEFEFDIYDHEIEGIKTVKDIVDFIEAHL